MARSDLLTDDELDATREAMREEREEIRADLAAAGVDVSGWSTPADEESKAERDAVNSD